MCKSCVINLRVEPADKVPRETKDLIKPGIEQENETELRLNLGSKPRNENKPKAEPGNEEKQRARKMEANGAARELIIDS